MKVAIMQPYFFPYIGYWQLIHAADTFVSFDDAQYMRHGWINRNRILKPGGGWQYFLVPLKKHAVNESIINVYAHPEKKWKELIIAQLAHYKKKARYFAETNKMVSEILFNTTENSIAAINIAAINGVSSYLGLGKPVISSSEQDFDYSDVGDAGEWALRIAEQLGASEYINPAAGRELFSREKFRAANVKLSFLTPDAINYSQQCDFEPSLSIIDVLMFNGVDGTKRLLEDYSIETCDQ